MIEKSCVHCGRAIVAASRRRFEQRYTDHVVDEHGKLAQVERGGAHA